MDYLWAFLCALGVSLLGTPLAMMLARRLGAVAPPRPDRWHKRPTPMLGGLAIYVAYTVTLLIFAPMRTEIVGLLVAGGAIFLLGLIDDLKPMRPSVKLAGQVAAACLLVPFGIHAIFIIHPVIAIPATLFWIVAITNAFNLLDNMDGLSSGVSAISAGFIFCIAVITQQPEVGTLAVALAGAALGFLVFNFNPARVFMGDCGSLFLGFNLGALTILGTWREASNLFLVLLVPLLVLAVPLFDTTLVTIMRKVSGRAISQGGRDHSSHRLVAMGLSERNAVLVLYAVCTAFGGLALLGLWLDLFVTALALGLLTVLILLFGVFLGEAKVYQRGAGGGLAVNAGAPAILRRLVTHKWLIIELLADVVLVAAAYLGAYLIRFEGAVPEPVPQQIHQLLPIVLPLQIAALVFFGVYQEEWRYGGLRANWKLLQAVVVGSGLSFVAVLLLTNFTFYSRAVFVVAGLLSLLFAMGSRSILRLLREWSRARRHTGRRAVIVGAGDAAERVIHELRRHPELGLIPVGLVDDDSSKHGRRVHGVPVLGACADLSQVAARLEAEEIVFAIPSARGAARQRLHGLCAQAGVPYRVALGSRDIVHFGGEGLVRPPRVEDHLSRGRLTLDESRLGEPVRGKTVLILGMGSAAAIELARWTQELGAERVYICDSDPVALVARLDMLAATGEDTRLSGRVCHLLDEDSVARVLRELRPDIVVSTVAIRSRIVAGFDLAGTLERNFLAAANIARQCTAAGVRSLVLWSTDPWSGPEGVAVRLGELAAAALGPPSVAVLRLPSIAEDPDNPLGQAVHNARLDATHPLIEPGATLQVALASEVAALTLWSLGQGDSTIHRLRVTPEPLLALVNALLYGRTPGTEGSGDAGAPAAEPPSVETLPLPRPVAATVESVARDVREALRGGRLNDALAATSLLVPSQDDEGEGGAMVALDSARRRSPQV